MKKTYGDYNDHELIYLINDNNEVANDLMYEKYKPLVMHYARKYSLSTKKSGVDVNDLFQEGMLGLYNAIKHYKEDSAASFWTFASVCIDRAICNATRNSNTKKQAYLNDSLSLDYVYDFYETTLVDFISDGDKHNPENIVTSKDEEKRLYNLISKNLSSSEHEIFELKRLGFNYDEISEILDISKKKITNTMQRVRYKVTKLIDGFEI